MCTKCNNNSCSGCAPLIIPEGDPGSDGWSPTFVTVNDGATRVVLQLSGWFGGTGTTPADFVGQYLYASGFTPVLASGQNIRGTDGNTSFLFVDKTGQPDQTVTYSDGVTPVLITGTDFTPVAGVYNLTFTGIHYGQENTATAKFGIYKNLVLQAILLHVGPHAASEKHNFVLMASNIACNGADVISVKCIETTVATHMNLFEFIETYQKIG